MEDLPLTTFSSLRGALRWTSQDQAFTCLDQYLSMAFAQRTFRETMRDIEACLRAQSSELYHLAFRFTCCP